MKIPYDPSLPITPELSVQYLSNLRFKLDLILKAISSQVNGLSEGFISNKYAAATSVPTTGTWAQGDFVTNKTPSEQGSAGSKYYVDGWKRLTNGSANVLNTDWVEARIRTGN